MCTWGNMKIGFISISNFNIKYLLTNFIISTFITFSHFHILQL